MTNMTAPFINTVEIRNYKSIAHCKIELGPLTFIVGRNGAGKSNFLDALHFLTDVARMPLHDAVRERGGRERILFRGNKSDATFVAVEFSIYPIYSGTGRYELEIKLEESAVTVLRECFSFRSTLSENDADICLTQGQAPQVRLRNEQSHALLENFWNQRHRDTALFGVPFTMGLGAMEFGNMLRDSGFFHFDVRRLKAAQVPDGRERYLRRHGDNLASVVARMQTDNPSNLRRVQQHLSAIVPEITAFRHLTAADHEFLEFDQRLKASDSPAKFYGSSVSDGTILALASLVAGYQYGDRTSGTLIGIEEPETALHPSAVAVLVSALREASEKTQVILTTHSPDVLDCFDPDYDNLLVTRCGSGGTQIGPADRASTRIIREHLSLAGDLLRQDHLEPVVTALPSSPGMPPVAEALP